jgi:hypothetical protein
MDMKHHDILEIYISQVVPRLCVLKVKPMLCGQSYLTAAVAATYRLVAL